MKKGRLFHLMNVEYNPGFCPWTSSLIERLLYIANQEGLKGNRLSDFEFIPGQDSEPHTYQCKCEQVDETNKENEFQQAIARA